MAEAIERRCITGMDPFKRFPTPIESAFDEDEYKLAPELDRVVSQLIANADEFGALAAYPPAIQCVWKAKAKKKQGKTVLGFCNKLSGLAKFYGGCDWTIEVSADAVRELQFTNHQVEALLFHELNHIEVVIDDETGDVSYKVRGEDAYAFVTEIKRYGAWKSDLQSVSDAWKQEPMFTKGKPEGSPSLPTIDDGVSATLTHNGRTVDFNDGEAAADLVRGVVRETMASARSRAGAVESTRLPVVNATAD